MRRLSAWAPAILWAALIAFLSTQYFGGERTSHIIIPFLQWLLPHTEAYTLERLHFLIRKSAHFVEYFIFSLLVLRGVRNGRKGWTLRWALLTILIAGGYAALDEFHQWFEPGRGASPMDSLLDTSGATAAQILAWAHARWESRRSARRSAA